MRGFSTLMVQWRWHKLITLACLLSFIFVAAAHAGHHLAISNDAAIVSAASTPIEGADDANALSSDGVCVFCALAAAEFPALALIAEDTVRGLVETCETALAPTPHTTEFPPPIT